MVSNVRTISNFFESDITLPMNKLGQPSRNSVPAGAPWSKSPGHSTARAKLATEVKSREDTCKILWNDDLFGQVWAVERE